MLFTTKILKNIITFIRTFETVCVKIWYLLSEVVLRVKRKSFLLGHLFLFIMKFNSNYFHTKLLRNHKLKCECLILIFKSSVTCGSAPSVVNLDLPLTGHTINGLLFGRLPCHPSGPMDLMLLPEMLPSLFLPVVLFGPD